MGEIKFFNFERWWLGNTPDRLGWRITLRFSSSFQIKIEYQKQ